MIHVNLDGSHVIIKSLGSGLQPIPMLCSIGSRPKGEANPIPDREALADLIFHCVTYNKDYHSRKYSYDDRSINEKLKKDNYEAYELIRLLNYNPRYYDSLIHNFIYQCK